MGIRRIDYVKVARSLHHDVAQQLANQWYDTFDPERGKDGATRHANVSSVRRNDDGSFLYIFEAWGKAAENVHQLSFDAFGPYLDRVDVREEIELTRSGVDRIYSHLVSHRVGNKNVNLYDTRARSKRKGRDSGGFGVALGSHKSDLRSTFYVRGTQLGACEFQCTGKKLADRVNAVKGIPQTALDAAGNDKWTALTTALYAMGWRDLQYVSGLSQTEFLQMAAGGDEVLDEVEARLVLIESSLDGLPREALYGLHEAIQHRLI